MVSCLAFLVFGLGPGTGSAALLEEPSDLPGIWSGNLQVSGAAVKITFNITAQTGLMSEYGKIEETFAPAALEIMGDWIMQRTGTR
ncbi:MAG: hypothetical protein JRD68_10410 [Deltaproteobacteria bacterium]|nr:hypothetical protein [Deltaproteobacteria bacterium]